MGLTQLFCLLQRRNDWPVLLFLRVWPRVHCCKMLRCHILNPFVRCLASRLPQMVQHAPFDVVLLQGSASKDSEYNSAALPLQEAPSQSRTVTSENR